MLEKTTDALENYIDILVDAIEEKLPALINDIMRLVDKADTLRSNASDEFDELGDWGKVKAIAKTLKLLADLPKIPAYLKKFVADLKGEIQ